MSFSLKRQRSSAAEAQCIHAKLDALARSFAESVLATVRHTTVDELLAEASAARWKPGRLRNPAWLSNLSPVTWAIQPRRRKFGPLNRRSKAEIESALECVVALLRASSEGLSAEKIRAALGMDSRELPRILKEGLAEGRLGATGRRRATTYTAAG
jgi:hypothetical protein